MAIITFIGIATLGLITTRIIARMVHQKYRSNWVTAFAIACGFSVTWFFSFLGPIAVGRNFRIEFGLFQFIMMTTAGIWIFLFGVVLHLLSIREHT